jgi:trehalose 6-phosphate phosphatase
MARFLLECVETLAPRITVAARLLLFLDFDGTLAPIVDSPENAALPEPTRRILSVMAARPEFLIALVSGRRVTDLRRRAGLRDVVYAGNHGLEICGAGIDFIDPVALAHRPALGALLSALKEDLEAIPGIEIEDKCWSASVHFRRAPESGAQVFRILRRRIDTRKFRARAGKMVYEILPLSETTKGSAARHIRSALGAVGDLPICAGDDTTDEDLFAAADPGFAIKVGDPAATCAAYFVHSVEEMRVFLFWLAGAARLAGQTADIVAGMLDIPGASDGR